MKYLNKIDRYLVYILIFAYPLFFLPYFINQEETSKLLLLSIFILLIGTVKIIKSLINSNFKLKFLKFDLLVLSLTLIYTISGYFVTPNKLDAFFLPGTASFVIFGTILYFFINQLETHDKKYINIAITTSGIILGIIQLLSFTGVIQGNYPLFGNNINTFAFLITAFAISTFEIAKESDLREKVFFGIAGFIIFISVFISFYLLIQKKTAPILPDIKSSWSISINSLKEKPFLGVGPTNFAYAYNKFRPLSINQTSNWDIKFLVPRNSPLLILAEVGIVGLILFLALFLSNLKNFKNMTQYGVSLLLIFAVSIFYPLSPSFWPFILLLFSLKNNAKETNGIFTSKIPLIIILMPFAIFILAGGYLIYKAFYPEYLFSKALKDISNNQVLDAYSTLNKAIQLNRYVDRYHLTSAEVNLALAKNLSQKVDITDQDKKTLASLIQQSIAEGKAAVSLNPFRYFYWEKLGDIYVSITPFAAESSKFAVQSYNQAIALNPIHPILRIKLGGVYYSQKQYDEAIKIFELAILAKPDFANSHFNLAMAYKSNGQIEKAKEQMNIVLQLVELGSEDYNTATSELDKLDKTQAGN